MGFDTKNLRNVVLLGHSGSGKTLFVESMLFESGAINRRGTIEGQNTASDYTKIEQERGNSLFSSLMHVEWRGNKINIIDTPGYDDFVGEVISSLKVADTAVMIVNAASTGTLPTMSITAKRVNETVSISFAERLSNVILFICAKIISPAVIPVVYPYLKTVAAGSAGNGYKDNLHNRPLYLPILSAYYLLHPSNYT